MSEVGPGGQRALRRPDVGAWTPRPRRFVGVHDDYGPVLPCGGPGACRLSCKGPCVTGVREVLFVGQWWWWSEGGSYFPQVPVSGLGLRVDSGTPGNYF